MASLFHSSMSLSRWWVVVLAGSAVAWWRIRLLGDLRDHLGSFFGWFGLVFLFYLGVLRLIRRAEQDEQEGHAHRAHAGVFGLVLLGAVLFRLLMLGTTPTLSDDIHRYRWDGRVQLSGIDPYAYPPQDPALAFLRDEEFASVNFPHLRSVYPPLTQQAFRLGAALGPRLTMQKVVFVLAEMVTVLSLLVILARRRRTPLWIAAYAWHPLVILEIAGQGHNDALGIAALWAGVAAWEGRRMLGAALGFAAAVLAKYLALILVPWWWCRREGRWWLLAFLACSAAPFLLYPNAIPALVETLSTMTGRGTVNASGYLLLACVTGHAATAVFLAVGLWVGFLLWWARRQPDPTAYLLGALAAAASLTPALHPWYLLWLIPCFCLWRVPALIALTGTAVLSYAIWPGYLADGRWSLPVWARVAEYAPVAALGVWHLFRKQWWSRSSFLAATRPWLFARSSRSFPER